MFDTSKSMSVLYGLLGKSGWENPTPTPDTWVNNSRGVELVMVHLMGRVTLTVREHLTKEPGESPDAFYRRRSGTRPLMVREISYGDDQPEFESRLVIEYQTISTLAAARAVVARAPGE